MGYDLLKRNVDCLKEGSIFFLIAQQPTLQGFDGIKAPVRPPDSEKRNRKGELHAD